MRHQTILTTLALALLGSALEAQLPLRNYIFFNQDTIAQLLEAEGMEFEVYSDDYYDDSYGYDYNLEEEPVYYEGYGEEEGAVKDEELALEPPSEETVIEPVEEIVEEEIPAPAVEEVPDEMIELPSESSIEVYSSAAFGYTNNTAAFYLRNDSCYLIQYDWYDDPFVLESIRKVMDQREDFSPCFDMKDCWVQQKPGEETLYYWNLFEKYEGVDNHNVLRIEAETEFETNRWWYQFSEGKQ
ncbi:MAG: hypothetical protein WA004_02170 [Saprospiraceae bacterium]